MSSRRFIVISAAIFILGALPFLIVQPTAASSAGLSLGFAAPFASLPIMALVVACGFAAALLPREGLVQLGLVFSLMVMVGGMLMLDVRVFPFVRYFVLGAILCLGLLVGITRQKFTLFALLLLASVGFHLGGFYLTQVPTIAAPIYYLLGVLLSLSLVLSISIAFGMTLFGDHEDVWEKLKESPRLAGIRDLFL
jgi:hydrogenase/urease accessory protein HupE